MQHEIFAVKDENIELRLPPSDNCVNTMTNNNQLESIDAHVPRKPEPVAMAADAPGTKVDMNQVTETERTLLRSSQQAKIPLKKRDLKLAESYHLSCLNSSSIIVRNPMRNQIKGPTVHCLGEDPPELADRRTAPPDLVGTERDKGLVGVVGHVGVIRSSSDCHVVPVNKQAELKVPCLETQPVVAKEPSSNVRQQSVLVKNVPTGDHVPKYDAVLSASEKSTFPSSFSLPPATERAKEKVEVTAGSNPVGPDEEKSCEGSRHPVNCDKTSKAQETEEGSETIPLQEGNCSNEREKSVGEIRADLSSIKPPEVEEVKTEDHLDGETPRFRCEEVKPLSGGRNGPRVEASSELQKEGIRLKIKIPPHRRDKLRGKEGKEKERKTHLIEVCKPLRRSARICR